MYTWVYVKRYLVRFFTSSTNFSSLSLSLFEIMQLLKWSFDWTYMVRGLVLDKKRGNILKVILNFSFSLFAL